VATLFEYEAGESPQIFKIRAQQT